VSFAALDPEEMEKGFADWVSSIAKLTAGEVIAIDGKALCGTREAGKKQLCTWFQPGPRARPGAGAAQVDEKSNESRPFPSCWRRWS